MPNRQLRALDEAIAACRLPRELPFLRAERATVLARLGERAQVLLEIAALRAGADAALQPGLHAWFWLAEGLADFYADAAARAHDRVRRALALATSTRMSRVLPLAAAWMAHMDFHVGDDASAVEHAALALRTAAADHHGARARACLVLAGMLHYAGSEGLAQPWYTQARVHAAADGDGATLSSILYNLMLLRIVAMRLADAFGAGGDPAALRRAMLGMASSLSLDHSVHTRALSHHPPMQRAQLLLMAGDWDGALALYDAHLPQAVEQGLAASECVYLADRAWCRAQLGQGDAALADARQAASTFVSGTESHDRAVAHVMLARVHALLGLADVADHHAAQARQAHAAYQARADALRSRIASMALVPVRTAPC
jgi:hypothetical protein